MKARRQGQDLTTAQGIGPIPLGHTHKPTLDLAAVWVKGSRKDTRRKSPPAWWAWCSTMTFRPSTGGSFGPHLSFLTPGICSQWPQTHLAADLPDTGWLKHDHARGSPAFPLWEHEHDLLSPFFLPPRNTKGPFFPILLSASHKDKQEYLMAEGLRLFTVVLWERPLTSGKGDYSLAHWTEYKQFKTCFSCNKWYMWAHTRTPKKANPKAPGEKQNSLPHPLLALNPSSEAASVSRLFHPPDHIHLSAYFFHRGFLSWKP